MNSLAGSEEVTDPAEIAAIRAGFGELSVPFMVKRDGKWRADKVQLAEWRKAVASA